MHRILFAAAFIAATASGTAQSADAARGATLAGDCAACHGPEGVSVAGEFPNLAAQKEDYLAAQLKAFRDGKRSNALMNPIASGFSDDDIADLAAHFSGLPGGEPGAEAPAFSGLDGSRLSFPVAYKTRFVKYHTIDFPKRKQVRYYWADPATATAAKAGEALPNGATVFVEVFKAKLDADDQPINGADGHFEADTLAVFTAMQKITGAGATVPSIFSNGDWRYAVFNSNRTRKDGVNEAKCLACHRAEDAKDYVFTLDVLTEFVKAN